MGLSGVGRAAKWSREGADLNRKPFGYESSEERIFNRLAEVCGIRRLWWPCNGSKLADRLVDCPACRPRTIAPPAAMAGVSRRADGLDWPDLWFAGVGHNG